MIILASDHAGFLLKEDIKNFLRKRTSQPLMLAAIQWSQWIIQTLQKAQTKKFWKTTTTLASTFVGQALAWTYVQTAIQKFVRHFVQTQLMRVLLVLTTMQMSLFLAEDLREREKQSRLSKSF